MNLGGVDNVCPRFGLVRTEQASGQCHLKIMRTQFRHTTQSTVMVVAHRGPMAELREGVRSSETEISRGGREFTMSISLR